MHLLQTKWLGKITFLVTSNNWVKSIIYVSVCKKMQKRTGRSLRDRAADRRVWSICLAGSSGSRRIGHTCCAMSGRARSAGTCLRSAAGIQHTLAPSRHRATLLPLHRRTRTPTRYYMLIGGGLLISRRQCLHSSCFCWNKNVCCYNWQPTQHSECWMIYLIFVLTM